METKKIREYISPEYCILATPYESICTGSNNPFAGETAGNPGTITDGGEMSW